MSGKFITFEGIEGCGKSTQIKLLDKFLRDRNFKIIFTREPGGTKIGDNIRSILLDPSNKKMHPLTELFLYEASRAQHLEELIKPALADGTIVLCDRYADSTIAYQGAARKLDALTIETLHQIATGGTTPDLTILLDLPAKDGLARVCGRGPSDRFEQEALDFHERVRQGYLELAKKEPVRVAVLDGLKKAEEIHKEILEIVCKLLGTKLN